eukprot:scaffold11840_cov133-Isochrysis_galbana.AAC.8
MRAADGRDAVPIRVSLATQGQVAGQGERAAEGLAAGRKTKAAGAGDGAGADRQVTELRVEGAGVPLLHVGEEAARL